MRAVLLSLVVHFLLILALLTLLPSLSRLAPMGRVTPAPDVLTFRFRDHTADVEPDSRVTTPPPTPLVAEFASRARDRVRDDRDTPIPLGGAPSTDNTMPGQAGETAPAAPAPTAGDNGTTAPAPSADGVRPGLVDGLGSELATLTGRPDAPRHGHGAHVMSDLGPGGALEFGDYSFSSKAWDYEPYWHYMRERLYANWHPPAAYKDYGIIPGGWTLVRAVLDRRGRVLRADIIGEDGHVSLHTASVAAMQGASPFRPLPADFPDDSLVVTVKFIYMSPPGPRP